MMLLSGVFLGLLSGLYCLSTQYTTLANASFLIYTGPIYSTILAAIFLKEKLNIKGVLCIAAWSSACCSSSASSRPRV